MKEQAQRLRSIVNSSTPELFRLDPGETRIPPAPGKWSKNEILGHLIDSAANNHQRFVRAAYGEAIHFTPYKQDEWVRIQQYNDVEWTDLITLWVALNRHLCHILESLPEESRLALCDIGTAEPVTLEFDVQVYLQHMQRHLAQILGE